MPQTSALRREELAPAPTHITINANDVPNPKNAEIANDGSVIFDAAKGCWVYFSPTDVFGDHLELTPGPNGPFYPERPDVTVSYCVTDPHTTCAPAPVAAAATTSSPVPLDGGNTIKVG